MLKKRIPFKFESKLSSSYLLLVLYGAIKILFYFSFQQNAGTQCYACIFYRVGIISRWWSADKRSKISGGYKRFIITNNQTILVFIIIKLMDHNFNVIIQPMTRVMLIILRISISCYYYYYYY